MGHPSLFSALRIVPPLTLLLSRSFFPLTNMGSQDRMLFPSTGWQIASQVLHLLGQFSYPFTSYEFYLIRWLADSGLYTFTLHLPENTLGGYLVILWIDTDQLASGAHRPHFHRLVSSFLSSSAPCPSPSLAIWFSSSHRWAFLFTCMFALPPTFPGRLSRRRRFSGHTGRWCGDGTQ